MKLLSEIKKLEELAQNARGKLLNNYHDIPKRERLDLKLEVERYEFELEKICREDEPLVCIGCGCQHFTIHPSSKIKCISCGSEYEV